MNLWERIQRLRQSRQIFEGHAADRAGRAAENLFFAQVSERLRGSGYRVWHGVRVPAQGRRREIDIVITSLEEVFLIELKNWSGQLVLNGEEVVQIRTNQQQPVNHGRLFHDVAVREQALQTWHWERTRTKLPMTSLVVFCNPRLRIEDQVLKKFGKVMCSASEFVAALPEPVPVVAPTSFIDRILGKPAQRTAIAEPKASADIVRFHETMEGLGSWDSVRLHGGALLNGDSKDRGEWISIDGANGDKLRTYDRQRIRAIDVYVNRAWWHVFQPVDTLELTLFLRDGSIGTAKVPYATTLKFQPAGSPEPEEIPLVHIERLDFGYIKKQSSKKG